MTIKFSDVSEIRALNAITAVSAADAWTLRHFKNDYTPVAGSVAASFTESTYPGYAAQAMASAFPAATTDAGGKASSQYPAQLVFTRNATGTAELCYGWYVTDSTNRLIMAERFDSPGPYSMALNGDTIKLQPTLKLSDPLTP